MATPTRPCPFCGQQVLVAATHCGYCGRPLPQQAAPPQPPPPSRPASNAPGAPAAQKTMMGYALPQNFGKPGAPAFQQGPPPAATPPPAAPPAAPQYGAPASSPPAQVGQPPGGPPPGQHGGFGGPPQPGGPPPGQFGGPPPGQQGGFGGPPQHGGPPPGQFGPPPGQHGGFGAPPQHGGPPPGQFGGPPPGQQGGFGGPPQHGGPPPGQFGGPPGGPPPGQFGGPPGGPPPGQFGGPPGGPPPGSFGGPPPGQFGGPPQQMQPYGQPPMQQFGAPPGAPAWMQKLPNKPGTLFGIPLHLLRDQRFERTVLAVGAVVLLLTRFIPVATGGGRTIWTFSTGMPKFAYLIFPILAAAIYALVALVPDHVRQRIPPAVLKWSPFFVAYFGTGYLWAAMPAGFLAFMSPVGMPGSYAAMAWSFPILVFGLICRMQDPEDMIARVMVGLGAFGALIGGLVNIGDLFEFKHAPVLLILHNMLFFFIILGMVASLVYAIPTKMVPQVAAAEPFLPIVTAILIVWAPIAAILIALSIPGVGNKLFILIHMLALQIGFYLVLMLTAPEALDALKRMLKGAGGPGAGYGGPGGPGGPGGWQQPPPGGGYPPPGGGYPPQGGGYPPQGGGGYPPQGGGGYPPQGGGGYPPQGGGGYPPQGGGGYPPR